MRLLAPTERKPYKTGRVRWVLGPEREVAAVRALFCDYACGAATIAAIVRRLHGADITTSYGRAITVMAIRMLLRNEIVIGNFVWGTRGPRQTVTNIAPLSESVRNSDMVPAIVDEATWAMVQARIRASVQQHLPGAPRAVVLESLREALCQDPAISRAELDELGLTAHAMRKNFGNVSRAYEAALRDAPVAAAPPVSPQAVGKRLLFDVATLLRSNGLEVRADPRSHTLQLAGNVTVNVRIARLYPGDRWQVNHMRYERGRWILVMRLNDDGVTGRDFYVLPPTAAGAFSGWINAASAPRLEPFRVPDIAELVARLRAAESVDSTDDSDSPWSG